MTSSVVLGVADFDDEKSQFQMYLPNVISANYDTVVTAINTIQAAIDAVLLEATSRRVFKAEDVPYGAPSAVAQAQREAKWRVIYTDNTDPIGNGSFEMPCPDLSLLVAGTGAMNIAAGAGATLVAALEADLLSRLGNNITVSKIVHVGRNI